MTLLPEGEDFSEHYPGRYLQGDYLKDEAKFIGKVGRIIEKLRGSIEPQRAQYELEFLPGDETVHVYPEVIRDRLMTRSLQFVNLSLVHEKGVPASTTIELGDEDGTIYISRDSDQSDKDSDDSIIRRDGTVAPLFRVSDRELHSFLLSLAGKYEQAEESISTPIDTPLNALQLFASLEAKAISHVSFEYLLASGRTVRFDVDRTDAERLNNFSISYEVADQPNAMSASIKRAEGLNISFSKRNPDSPLQDQGLLSPIFPEGGDYIRLIEIINEELANLTGIRKAKKLSKLAIIKASLLDDREGVLNEDRLDSPDSSTT